VAPPTSLPQARPARSRQHGLNVLTLRPILTGMSRKPQQSPQPTKTKWHVYKLAAKRQWVGEIEAVDEREAIEIAAKEFKQPATKLMAVPRR
jgi:hypothetical protein